MLIAQLKMKERIEFTFAFAFAQSKRTFINSFIQTLSLLNKFIILTPYMYLF